MEKKNFCVVLGTDNKIVFALANVIIGLTKHSDECIDNIVVFHDGFTPEDMESLSKINNKLILKEYSKSVFLEKVYTYGDSFEENFLIKLRSHVTFSIFEIFDLLNEYKQVLWLDCDMVIQKDISEILTYSNFSMRLDVGHASMGRILKNCPPHIDRNRTSYNTGVVLIDDSLPDYKSMTQSCYEILANNHNNLVFLDQAVINFMINTHNIEITELPKKFNLFPFDRFEHLLSAIIIHTTGYCRKTWDNEVYSRIFPEWRQNNEEWKKIGGKEYGGDISYKNILPNSLYDLCMNSHNSNAWVKFIDELEADGKYFFHYSKNLFAKEFYLYFPKTKKSVYIKIERAENSLYYVTLYVGDVNAEKIHEIEKRILSNMNEFELNVDKKDKSISIKAELKYDRLKECVAKISECYYSTCNARLLDVSDMHAEAIKVKSESKSIMDIALSHFYKNTILLGSAHIEAIASAILTRSPNCNLLVFGCGEDSAMWHCLNKTGKSVFLETSPHWIQKILEKFPYLDIRDYDLPGASVEKSLAGINPDMPKPSVLTEYNWDVIFIDGPSGYAPNLPGRALPIIWASQIRKPTTHVFVDDYNRELEKMYTDKYLQPAAIIESKLQKYHSVLAWSIGSLANNYK